MSPKWEACRGITMFMVIFVLFLNAWRLYSKNHKHRIDDAWNGNDTSNCLELKHNPSTDELDCNKRNGSKIDTTSIIMMICFTFFLFWMIWFLIIILKHCHSRLQPKSARDQEHPGIGVSTISRDFSSLNTTNTNLSEIPIHIITLLPSPTTTSAETGNEHPPEYFHPPAYNECAINVGDPDYHHKYSGSRIV